MFATPVSELLNSARSANRERSVRQLSARSPSADRGRRSDRHAGGAGVHRPDNQYGPHGEQPHGRSLGHVDAPPHVRKRDALNRTDQDLSN
jgi:hypothetical protein